MSRDDQVVSDGIPGQAQEAVHLSVIVPVFNGEPFFVEQLEAIAAQECSFKWELIVVDNGSTDGSAETARRFRSRIRNLKILSEPEPGKPAALNTGRAAARGRLLVLLDADDIAAPGYLEAMAKALDAYEMVSGRMDTVRLNALGAQEEYVSPDRIRMWYGYLPHIGGGLTGIRAEAWDRIGGISPSLRVSEDIDFTWRASRAGVSMGMAPDAVLHYRRPTRAWPNFLKGRSYGRSSVWLYQLHRTEGQPRISLMVDLHNLRLVLHDLLHREELWWWRVSYRLGLIEGRLEECARQRVWYP